MNFDQKVKMNLTAQDVFDGSNTMTIRIQSCY